MANIQTFIKMKNAGEKITVVTCYDFASAKMLEKSRIDCLLVGDSVAMVMHGYENTTHATLPMMVMHTQAVSKGAKQLFIVADMPFLSYRKSLSDTMHAVTELMQAGANAVKLEGIHGNFDSIRHIVESGVPVMGHLGLTPQHIHQLGGFKVQGRDKNLVNDFIEQAKQCEAAGCFALVLECVPSDLAAKITQAISIPTIGIGAGADTDGQVLVLHDLLGFDSDMRLKFVKQYSNAEAVFLESIEKYIAEVKQKTFPSKEHSFDYR